MRLLRPIFSSLSPAGEQARLTTLIFHRVLPEVDPLFPGEVDARRFDAICRWLAGWFNVLPLDDAVWRLHAGTLPSRAACITFDDGYADNHDVAMPILHRHGLTATFFVATGFLGGGRMFNDTIIEAVRRHSANSLNLAGLGVEGLGNLATHDLPARRQAIATIIGRLKYLPQAERDEMVGSVAGAVGKTLPRDLMMTPEKVRRLHAAGMQIGAHTVIHPILARLSGDAARDQITRGKTDLECLLGAPVSLFAYPNGKPNEDYDASHVRAVKEAGFAAAVSTHWGAASHASDRFQLPRFTPWDRSPLRFGLRLATNLRNMEQPIAA